MNDLPLFKLSAGSDATISACGLYRYWLERRWGRTAPQVFVMLNPSTADASVDDPTIRRCIAFAKREGAGGLIVVNLFALRATDPSALDNHADPVGPANVENLGLALIGAVAIGRPVICAWGANKNAGPAGMRLLARANDLGAALVCLGLTKDGQPRHPLYVKGDAPLIAFDGKMGTRA